jgi:hypothetical protein
MYEIRFIKHGGHIFGSDRIQAKDDAAAIAYANRLMRSPFGHSHEIWEGDRFVHREIYR